MQILGVKVDNFTRDEALAEVTELLKAGQHIITTPNPEIILEAQKDKEFKRILNNAELSLPDGFGLILMSRFLKEPLKERIAGTDFMQDICALAEKMNKTIYLLGARDGVASKAAAKLIEKYPKLRIVGAEKGIQLQNENYKLKVDFEENQKLIERINKTSPDILFVAFGGGKQEKWITQNLSKIPSVKIAMGIGGAFDFIAGVVPRAPFWMRKIGLEWLWRFINEPWRSKRVYNAAVKFPIKIILSRVKNT